MFKWLVILICACVLPALMFNMGGEYEKKREKEADAMQQKYDTFVWNTYKYSGIKHDATAKHLVEETEVYLGQYVGDDIALPGGVVNIVDGILHPDGP